MNLTTNALPGLLLPRCSLLGSSGYTAFWRGHANRRHLGACGFRHSDTILLTQKEPVRYTLAVETIDDLDARVIRSSSGTIRVPELGVDIEPGFASESYISNVEGVLDRIEGIVCFATRSAREAENLEGATKGDGSWRILN